MVEYPQTPEQWRTWIRSRIEMPEENAIALLDENEFPIEALLSAWQSEFAPTKGYSSDFISALTRNRNGFLLWVYKNGPEPNWRKSD